ncbi:M23 family metallopeptidase [bacterium]|nr:M23 family metallopeptidase [bacterium]
MAEIKILVGFFLYRFILPLFNPLTWRTSFLQYYGQTSAYFRYKARPPISTQFCTKIEYSLPFQGTWLVSNGGTNKENSHSWGIYAQRFAYDFIKEEDIKNINPFKKNKLDDCTTFNQLILAPADGKVVDIKDGLEDFPEPGSYKIDWKTKDIRGNYIILQHGPNEFSLLAHLSKKSILVKPGDHVARYQVIAKCGNSGNSTTAHLHFQIQDRINCFSSVSLPIKFRNIVIENSDKPSEFIEKDNLVKNVNQS